LIKEDGITPCTVLHYADDALIVLKGEAQGVVALKERLDQFAAMTGLHINFIKSTIGPIHMNDQVVQECVDILPQTHLCLPPSTAKLQVPTYTPYITSRKLTVTS
jgi:hypothetical protein